MFRRQAIQGLLGFAAVGKGAVESVAKGIAARQSAVMGFGAPLPDSHGVQSAGSSAINWQSPPSLVFRRARAQAERRRGRQVAGLDPDLAALGATSYAWRRLIQDRREHRSYTVVAQLARFAGLDWEDPL